MYNKLKTYKNKTYTGMKIGNSHHWNYKNGKWLETKEAPDKWSFNFNSGFSFSYKVKEKDLALWWYLYCHYSCCLWIINSYLV